MPSGRRWKPCRGSLAATVGHCEDEDALALVARADFCRREQSALNRETQLAKVSPYPFGASDVVIPRREHAADIFDEDEPRSCLDDDAAGRRPEIALVEAASLLSGKGMSLARDAANEAVHASTPAPAVEGSGIAPNRSLMQESRFHR
nr:hypothetical protein [Mesorhizobium onobrychidis]